MHFAVRDAAAERAEPVAARALRHGEQQVAGAMVAQQGTRCLMQRVGAWKTFCTSKEPSTGASRKSEAEPLWAVNALLQVADESFPPAKSSPLKPHLKVRLAGIYKSLNPQSRLKYLKLFMSSGYKV